MFRPIPLLSRFALASFAALTFASDAFAAATPAAAIGEPVDKGLGLQPAASPVKVQIDWLHNEMMYIVTAITLFVLALLVIVVLRYNRHVNKVPSNTTHHVKLEIAWTLVPVLILGALWFPSMTLLYYENRTPAPDMTLKVTGHQWYWSYEYPDNGNISFDARPVWVSPTTTDAEAQAALKDSQPNWLLDDGTPRRLLETDNRLVLPVDTNVRVLINGADVIHSWSVPALGVKRDAMPGHLNETWLRATKEGVFYGQCSQICGAGHGYMPIALEVVSKARFAQWVKAHGTPEATPAQPVSDSAKATAQPTTTLTGDKKPAEQANPSQAAKPAEAAPIDQTPEKNPAAPPNPDSGNDTGNPPPNQQQ